MCNENFGGRIGRKLGNLGYDYGSAVWDASAAGQAFKKAKEWFGNGDYTIQKNSIIDSGGAPGELKMITNGNPWTDFVYREYLGDLQAPAAPADFNLTSYHINPGLAELQPWLSPIAQQFEQYEPMGIVFEYQSLLSDYSSTQVLGSVMMATDYDVTDRVYFDKLEMMNAQYSSQAKPTQGLLHGIECDPNQRQNKLLFVRSGAIKPDADLQDYDLGIFQVATQGLGVAAGTVIGSLFVHYHYRFYKSQLTNGLLQKGTLCALTNFIPQIANANTFLANGSLTPVWTYNNLGLTFTTADRSRFIFPPELSSGTFAIIYYMEIGPPGPGATCTIQLGTLVNCVAATNVDGFGQFMTGVATGLPTSTVSLTPTFHAGVGGDNGALITAVTITAAGASVNLLATGLSTPNTDCATVCWVVNISNFNLA